MNFWKRRAPPDRIALLDLVAAYAVGVGIFVVLYFLFMHHQSWKEEQDMECVSQGHCPEQMVPRIVAGYGCICVMVPK